MRLPPAEIGRRRTHVTEPSSTRRSKSPRVAPPGCRHRLRSRAEVCPSAQRISGTSWPSGRYKSAMRRFALAAALLALCLISPGCAALRKLFESAFKRPELKFKTLAVREVTLSGTTLDTVWLLENPNPVGLSLAQIDYSFFVEGKQIVAGKPRNGLQIPASKSAELTFPAEVKFQDLVPALGVFLQKDVATYRAEGTLGVQTPLGVLRFPLRKEGTFEVPKVPALAFESPRLRSMGVSGAQLEVPLTLTNRNSFPLPVGGISGNLSIGGARVGT